MEDTNRTKDTVTQPKFPPILEEDPMNGSMPETEYDFDNQGYKHNTSRSDYNTFHHITNIFYKHTRYHLRNQMGLLSKPRMKLKGANNNHAFIENQRKDFT